MEGDWVGKGSGGDHTGSSPSVHPCHAERSEASLWDGGRRILHFVQDDRWGEVKKAGLYFRLQQTQLASASDGFRAALHLEFGEDVSIVAFDGAQREEQP